MKSMLSVVLGLAVTGVLGAETIKLPAPDADSGVTVMQALKARHSERAFADRDLSLEMLSGVLWAANGFNRPDTTVLHLNHPVGYSAVAISR